MMVFQFDTSGWIKRWNCVCRVPTAVCLLALNLAREAEKTQGQELDSRLRGDDGAPSCGD